MSTINTNLSPSLASTLSDSRQALGRSLVGLSTGVRSVDASGIAGLDPNSPAAAIASQNLLSAIADPAAASAAVQSVVASISAQPGAALAAQGNLASDAVWGLLQQDE